MPTQHKERQELQIIVVLIAGILSHAGIRRVRNIEPFDIFRGSNAETVSNLRFTLQDGDTIGQQ